MKCTRIAFAPLPSASYLRSTCFWNRLIFAVRGGAVVRKPDSDFFKLSKNYPLIRLTWDQAFLGEMNEGLIAG